MVVSLNRGTLTWTPKWKNRIPGIPRDTHNLVSIVYSCNVVCKSLHNYDGESNGHDMDNETENGMDITV